MHGCVALAIQCLGNEPHNPMLTKFGYKRGFLDADGPMKRCIALIVLCVWIATFRKKHP